MPDNEAQSMGQALRRLVDIRSVSGEEEAITEHLRRSLPRQLPVVRDEDTVLFAAGPSERPLVILAGHTDTVPIEDNFPSFERDGVVHGRGTSDMKAGLAVMLQVAQWWAGLPESQREASGVELGLLFFGREELSQQHNPLPHALVTEPRLNEAALAVLMEPTSNQLQLGCLGNLNLTLRFSGETAHSARPWLGRNAADLAIQALQAQVDVEPSPRDCEGLTFYDTQTITGIRGGTARNVVPSLVEVDVNLRYSPSTDADALERRWREWASGKAAVEVSGHAIPAPVNAAHPLVRRLVHRVGQPPGPKQAWTNAADFAAAGVAAVNFGPGDPALAHRRDESVHLDALGQSFSILSTYLSKGGSAE